MNPPAATQRLTGVSWSSKIVLITAIGGAASVVGFLISTEIGSGYASPDDAVRASCHAAAILGDYSAHNGRYEIGWQPRGEEPGSGWTAIVKGSDGDYSVIDCRHAGITHG